VSANQGGTSNAADRGHWENFCGIVSSFKPQWRKTYLPAGNHLLQESLEVVPLPQRLKVVVRLRLRQVLGDFEEPLFLRPAQDLDCLPGVSFRAPLSVSNAQGAKGGQLAL
jgi:hypothetical protein